MHRIDSDGHVDNLFVDEDANQAIAGTKMAADWLNAIQEELINILIAAEIDPNKASNDQLALAFQLLGGSKEWTDILNKPTTFPPDTHNHNTLYAALSHNHNTLYAALSHNHNTLYAALSHNHNTLYAALLHTHSAYALLSDFVKFHAQNGYQKFPGGLIIQWGSNVAGSTIFPIAFPNNAFVVNATRDGSGSTDNPPQISTITSTSFYVSQQSYWVAIGN